MFTKRQRVKWDSNHKQIINAPPNHQKIGVSLIFAVKHDGRHKARLVADGSLTPEPVENIYSGVVSQRHLRLVIFLGELNNLELWGADIGNAYLEAYTHEKLFIIAGPEFEELEGFILIFNKALKTKHYSTRHRTEKPECSYLPDMKYDWSYTVYGNVQEIIPNNCPKPLGKSVTTTTTLDANLLHCLATGASLTACLHFCNQTPTDWYSKKQATVEMATYGSEFVAAKQQLNR